MPEIRWITPIRGAHRKHKDILLTCRKIKDGTKKATIRFYNDSNKTITQDNAERVVIAVSGQRLYIKQNDMGFKILKGSELSRCIKSNDDEVSKFCERYEGHYWLKYDVENKLYYVDVTERD